jgi:hypothetical protein
MTYRTLWKRSNSRLSIFQIRSKACCGSGCSKSNQKAQNAKLHNAASHTRKGRARKEERTPWSCGIHGHGKKYLPNKGEENVGKEGNGNVGWVMQIILLKHTILDGARFQGEA